MDRPKLLAQIGETLARMEDSKLSDLADRVQALEKENASLTTKLTDGETATKTLNSQIKTLGDRLKDSQDANTEYRAERQTREDEIKALQADKKELQTENKTLQERVKLLQPLEDARLKAEVARIDEDYRLQQNSRIDIHPTVRQQTTDEYYRVHPELRPPNYQTPEEREERAKERAGRKERQTDSTFRSPN